MMRSCAALMALAILTGCNPTVKAVALTAENTGRSNPLPTLKCDFRLMKVLDERPAGDSAGGLGWNQLTMETPETIVRHGLSEGGMHAADALAGEAVVVSLKRMYVADAQTSKNAVVVYAVSVEGGAPYLIRAQQSHMNWNGSQGEAIRVFSRALASANEQLFISLNHRCMNAAG